METQKFPHEENFNCRPKGYYGKIKLKTTKFFLNKFKKKFSCDCDKTLSSLWTLSEILIDLFLS